ncbi:PTS transporter subunit EIIC [Tetragenococcus halophilus]|uniref:PTS transporter subunit EIIC n=1 Tax=Tetragenococcus halophilus TaxID=51669 RepID=UPI00083D6F39|nr:PTS transporter subunit EIIC [Tetragenococcus halophilus]AOF49884.1 PTS system lactose-specific transporter subunits IICB [Tetragenococcus halophilus]MCF1685979.1 PTS transporter subunit EIIC [Tetragenococcus halophilus]MCO8289373.1 PTS transporter subunit EIIC [Tetragenococcus halophilus]MCT8310735.1 PTS transporter subunit EIIC [Tetragenococcus halophilus]
MNKIIKLLEKNQGTFEKISQNIYLQAIKDGFLNAMPVILFSSIFLLLANVPEVIATGLGIDFALPETLTEWFNKIYEYTMGIVGLMVAGTTAKNLAVSMNRRMPDGKVIGETSVMLASLSGFLLLAVSKTSEGNFEAVNMDTHGLLSAFVSAFLTVNMFKFCITHDITIRLPKEVPGTISQNFRDIFAFSFSVLGCALIDIIARVAFKVPFADILTQVFAPLFGGVESYLGMSIVWLLIPMFWFVGVHGPSVVKPAITAALIGNTSENLELFQSGEFPHHALTENFGNFVGELGGTGATLVVPFIFMFAMHSKQLKAVGKASFIPVLFSVNEPLLFAAPIILNPYFFIPFLIAPVVNVVIGKLFIDVLSMNGIMYVLPWASPGPLGLFLGTNFDWLSLVLSVVLIIVDILIYYPFCRAYDRTLIQEETEKTGEIEENYYNEESEMVVAENNENIATEKVIDTNKGNRILVICAGSGTSEQLAGALNEAAEKDDIPITAKGAAYGSHYDLLPNYDAVILAPQVKMYRDDIQEDADKYGVKVIIARGKEYVQMTQAPQEALNFVLKSLNE